MKKSLLAIAAMTAFAGAAQAQSSVTVYGIVDAGVLTINNTTGSSASNNNRTTGLQSGGLASPRMGFMGAEDLGGGTKANFKLEAEILTATGQADGVSQKNGSTAGSTNGQLFNRASWVGLSNATYGETRLGLQNSSNYDNSIAYDALGGANLGGFVNSTNSATAHVGSGDSFATQFGRVNNSYSYISPKFMGLNATVVQGYKQADAGTALIVPNATNAAGMRETDFGLNYGYKDLAVSASYASLASANGFSDSSNGTVTGSVAGTSLMGVYASYDFQSLKAFASHVQTKGQGVGGQTNQWNAVGISAPLTPKISVAASFTALISGSSYTNNNGNMSALKATYAFSKRTSLYALGALSSNQANAQTQITSTSKFTNTGVGAAGLNQTGMMLGLNHTF